MSSAHTISSRTQQTKPWPAINPISTSERLPITQPPQYEWVTRTELENLRQLLFFSAFHLYATQISLSGNQGKKEIHSYVTLWSHLPCLIFSYKMLVHCCRKVTKWLLTGFPEGNAIIFRWRMVRRGEDYDMWERPTVNQALHSHSLGTIRC